MSVELGAYACLACDLKAGSPAVLVMRVRDLSYREALDYLSSLGIQPTDSGEYSGKPWTKRSGQKFKQPWHRGRRTA